MKILNKYNIQFKIKDFNNFKIYKQKFSYLKINNDIFDNMLNNQIKFINNCNYFNFINLFFIITKNKFVVFLKSLKLKNLINIKLNNYNFNNINLILKNQILDISNIKIINIKNNNINKINKNILNNIKNNFKNLKII